MLRYLLSVLLLIPIPLLANETETTVTETFNDQQINTDIDILYGGNDTEVAAATTASPECASTEVAGSIGIEDLDCFGSEYFSLNRHALGIRGSADSITIAFPNEPYEVGFQYGATDVDTISGTVYYDNGASETFTLDQHTDYTTVMSKSWTVAEGVDTFITEIVIDGLTGENPDWYLIDNIYYKYDNSTTTSTSSTSTTSSTTTSSTTTTTTPPTTTSTTTTTTLPKAEDVVEDGITTYLAWDKDGCEHPDNPLSYKQYLEAVESGNWFGYQGGDCSDIPDVVTIVIAEEEVDNELDQEILEDDTLTEEIIEEEVDELTEEEIAAIEAEIKAEEEKLIQEQLDAEEELLILEELEDSVIILEGLTEQELEEFVDVIQEIEDTIEIIEIIEEVIELDIPEDVIVIEIEEDEVIEDDIVIVVEDEEVDEEVLVEPIQEDVEEKPKEKLSEEEIVEELAEVEEVIEEIIEIEIVEEDLSEEEIEEVIEEYVEKLETEEVIEVLEEVNDVGVQNLEEVSEEVQEVIQAVVEEAIEDVEELTEEQVEVVAEVLQVETEDVEIIAEAVKEDEVVAEAVEEYVERAVENADVEDYTLADVVTEVQYEAFLENPIEVFVDFDNITEINLSNISDDMTQDQKEKAQEVVVPVILTRIASMAAFIFRRS
jgi:hypothetical protein